MTIKSSTFHPTHVHSYYSILDGVGSIDEYAQIAVKEGMGYLCVTDHHQLGAWPTLLETCDRSGLRPVFGMEVYVNDWHHLVPKFASLNDDEKRKVRRNNHVLLFAETQAGFMNLIRLATLGTAEGFYYRPRVSREQIWAHSEGLVATTGCLSSPINQQLLAGNKDDAFNLAREWADHFKGRLWVEWMMIGLKPQDQNNISLADISQRLGLPPLITNDTHYQLRSDAVVQSVQLAMARKDTTISQVASTRLGFGEDPNKIAVEFGIPSYKMREIVSAREQKMSEDEDGEGADDQVFQLETQQLWFTTETEMAERWESSYKKDLPATFFDESVAQTLALCQRCGYVEPDRSPKLPQKEDAEAKLRQLAFDGLAKMGKNTPQYTERVEKELKVIFRKGFASYFLIQLEIINAARAMGCPIGPGRGSVGGCMVACAVGIDEIDSVKHGTYFERFLSYSRGGRQMCCSLH